MQAIVTTAKHRAIQFPGLFTLRTDKIQPIQRNVQRTDANAIRDSILRCTRQINGAHAHNRRVRFLSGVEVREVSMDDWNKANEAFQPVWFR